MEAVPTPLINKQQNDLHYHSESVKLDPDNILNVTIKQDFKDILVHYDNVFQPNFKGYNGSMGNYKCHINMGHVLPPQRKGSLPQYSRDKLIDCRSKSTNIQNTNNIGDLMYIISDYDKTNPETYTLL